MLASLDRLAALPDETQVCCAHEYTLSNLRFARAVEPDNPDLAGYTHACDARRAAGKPTLPSTIATERRINPFLRSREPTVRHAVQQQDPAARSSVEVFAALRRWKDGFSLTAAARTSPTRNCLTDDRFPTTGTAAVPMGTGRLFHPADPSLGRRQPDPARTSCRRGCR